MWDCPKCREQVEDRFAVCWNCGTSPDGVEDPAFHRPADPSGAGDEVLCLRCARGSPAGLDACPHCGASLSVHAAAYDPRARVAPLVSAADRPVSRITLVGLWILCGPALVLPLIVGVLVATARWEDAVPLVYTVVASGLGFAAAVVILYRATTRYRRDRAGAGAGSPVDRGAPE